MPGNPENKNQKEIPYMPEGLLMDYYSIPCMFAMGLSQIPNELIKQARHTINQLTENKKQP